MFGGFIRRMGCRIRPAEVHAGDLSALSTGALMSGFMHFEKKYFRLFQRILRESDPVYDASPLGILSAYNVSVAHTGETMDNLLKIFYTLRHHPDVALFVQASPAFCCPSLVTEAWPMRSRRRRACRWSP